MDPPYISPLFNKKQRFIGGVYHDYWYKQTKLSGDCMKKAPKGSSSSLEKRNRSPRRLTRNKGSRMYPLEPAKGNLIRGHCFEAQYQRDLGQSAAKLIFAPAGHDFKQLEFYLSNQRFTRRDFGTNACFQRPQQWNEIGVLITARWPEHEPG